MADENVLRSIGVIARALDSIANIEFKQFDLTRGQYLYLVRVCEHPGIIQERLIEMIKVDRTSASRVIQKLEKNGFIMRQADAVNKKIKHIFPTDKGQRIYPQIKRENDYSTTVALQGLSSAQIKTVTQLLTKMSANVSADWEGVKKGQPRQY
ncbi:MAG: MarR family transcriptional regulator [Lactobacillus sp.]|jgi:DNA-binding MarR family transcriptional regulator|nr:MAG: MarR family transcriptional regulator [Lactobacillus sp.]